MITKKQIIGMPRAGNFNYSEQDNNLGRLLSAMTSLKSEDITASSIKKPDEKMKNKTVLTRGNRWGR